MLDSTEDNEVTESHRIVEVSRQIRLEAERARLGLADLREKLAEQRRAKRRGGGANRQAPEDIE